MQSDGSMDIHDRIDIFLRHQRSRGKMDGSETDADPARKNLHLREMSAVRLRERFKAAEPVLGQIDAGDKISPGLLHRTVNI